MIFLSSIVNAIVDRTPAELIGALLVSGAVAAVVAALHVRGRRKEPLSPTFIGGITLGAGLACMALTAGYIEYAASPLKNNGAGAIPQSVAGWAPAGQGGSNPPAPWGTYGAGWSSGVHIVMAADEDHDGRLTPDEAARFVRQADIDGDGTVDAQDIDKRVIDRFRLPFQPFGSPSPSGTAYGDTKQTTYILREPPSPPSRGDGQERSSHSSRNTPGDANEGDPRASGRATEPHRK